MAWKIELALPVSTDPANTMIIIIILSIFGVAPRALPRLLSSEINPMDISPVAKISAATSKITTFTNRDPIPSQKYFIASKLSFNFFVHTQLAATDINRVMNMAVVISIFIGGVMKLNIDEKSINKMRGRRGNMANRIGTVTLISLWEVGIGICPDFRSKCLL